jgi:hypothetical protein
MGWVTKTLSSRVPPCFGRHVKLLVPAAFAVVCTHQSALGSRGGLWPVLLVGNPLGRPVPQQWDINRLMMMMIIANALAIRAVQSPKCIL